MRQTNNYVKEYKEGVDRMSRELEVNETIAPIFHADDFILKVTVAKVTEKLIENPDRLIENPNKWYFFNLVEKYMLHCQFVFQ